MLEEDTWRDVASGEQASWEWRARIFGKFVRPTDTVFDFGAGNRKLARFIPPASRYVPIDAVDTLAGTFVVDFNKEFRIPDGGFTIAACAGFLEYIEDVPGFFRNLSLASPGSMIIFSYLMSQSTAKRSSMIVTQSYSSPSELLGAISNSISSPRVISTIHETIIVSAMLDGDGHRHTWQDPVGLDGVFMSVRKPGFVEKCLRSLRKRASLRDPKR